MGVKVDSADLAEACQQEVRADQETTRRDYTTLERTAKGVVLTDRFTCTCKERVERMARVMKTGRWAAGYMHNGKVELLGNDNELKATLKAILMQRRR